MPTYIKCLVCWHLRDKVSSPCQCSSRPLGLFSSSVRGWKMLWDIPFRLLFRDIWWLFGCYLPELPRQMWDYSGKRHQDCYSFVENFLSLLLDSIFRHIPSQAQCSIWLAVLHSWCLFRKWSLNQLLRLDDLILLPSQDNQLHHVLRTTYCGTGRWTIL